MYCIFRKHFISGSFDGMVKIWSAKPTKGSDSGASEAKKARSDSTAAKPVTRTPLRTLGGHKEAISGVAWQKEEGFFLYIISYLTCKPNFKGEPYRFSG